MNSRKQISICTTDNKTDLIAGRRSYSKCHVTLKVSIYSHDNSGRKAIKYVPMISSLAEFTRNDSYSKKHKHCSE